MPEPKTPFARFFRSVEGKLVSRYGTASQARANALIGASRDPETGVVSWDTGAIIAITPLEAQRFKREYDRAVRDWALTEVTEQDYLDFLQRGEDRAREHEEKAKQASDAAVPADDATRGDTTSSAGEPAEE